ncbi:MAG: nucleotidyltransferase domain-containing protein, partial [bacterium]
IIVFGSQVNRKTDKDSDIDVVVVSPDFRKKNIFKRVEMIGDAHSRTVSRFMVPLDILLKTPEEVEGLPYIRQGGVVIFAA